MRNIADNFLHDFKKNVIDRQRSSIEKIRKLIFEDLLRLETVKSRAILENKKISETLFKRAFAIDHLVTKTQIFVFLSIFTFKFN